MASLATLINEVCEDCGNRTDITAAASSAVALSIRHYDNRRWWFSEGSATFTASATSSYSLPSDFKGMDYVEVRLSNGAWDEVDRRTWPEIKQALEQTAQGIPEIYAVHDQKVHISKFPGSTNELTVRYYYRKSLTSLTASASNIWTNELSPLIRAAAAKTVSLRTLHDPELAALHAGVESSEYNNLVMENEQRVMSGTIEPH